VILASLILSKFTETEPIAKYLPEKEAFDSYAAMLPLAWQELNQAKLATGKFEN
jgi:hypothetical protein